jgi:transposase
LLIDEQATLVGMESRGVYWKPIYYLGRGRGCSLLNAQHLKKVPGRKTDSEWITELVAHGLVRPSFVPPRPIRQLRDLTRYRAAVTQDRTREVQRLQNTLEDAGIKLDAMVSDVIGASARRMLAALIGGERDPQVLAELALGRMRPKVPDPAAGVGRPFQRAPCRLCAKMLATIPGVSNRVAEVIIAETGGDMSRFPSPQSWLRGLGCVRATTNLRVSTSVAVPARVTGGYVEPLAKHPPQHYGPGTPTCRADTDAWPADVGRRRPRSQSDTTYCWPPGTSFTTP